MILTRLILFSCRRLPLRMSSSFTSAFSPDEASRYSRQLLMNEIGTEGQLKLRSTSVLIVGCGGLGCPAGIYLAAAGIGKIGFVDNDVVERSNLHRQILHNELRIGIPKTQSAIESLKALNSNVEFQAHNVMLNRTNAIDIIKDYHIVIDATDNPMARYLLSDVCVLNKKPLVSGSALRFEGQLTVYNYDKSTPCYRCLYPNPPPPGTVTNCSDGGVLGVIPGIIGSMQALETMKIAIGIKPAYAGKMLLFDGMQGSFRTLQIREKKADCISCGTNPTITSDLIDYEEFCGVKCASQMQVKILTPDERMTVEQYKQDFIDSNKHHLLIDVRAKLQSDISKLSNAIQIPLEEIQKGNGLQTIEDLIDQNLKNDSLKVVVMCRRGIASQKAVRVLKDKIKDNKVEFKDVIGGLEAWAKNDSNFPMY